MNERFASIREEILNGMNQQTSSREVYEFRKLFMDSKTGKIGQLMKEMKNIPPQ